MPVPRVGGYQFWMTVSDKVTRKWVFVWICWVIREENLHGPYIVLFLTNDSLFRSGLSGITAAIGQHKEADRCDAIGTY